MRIIEIAKGTIAASMVMFFFGLPGCGGESLPTEADVKSAVEGALVQFIEQGKIEIESVTKVDSQRESAFGEESYSIDYEMVVVYPKGLRSMGTRLEPGESVTYKDYMSFELKENGWSPIVHDWKLVSGLNL